VVVRGELPFHFVQALSQKTRVAVGHDVAAEAKDAKLAVTAPGLLAARLGRRRAQRWSPARHQMVDRKVWCHDFSVNFRLTI
jgi:hypothetical protein